tara:strand:- start:5888 stop:6043 length:156 start_codon:yes stop_codon:yes gene_type:complete
MDTGTSVYPGKKESIAIELIWWKQVTFWDNSAEIELDIDHLLLVGAIVTMV